MSNLQEPRLTDIAYVKQLMARYGRHFDKRFGQNFLINPTVPRKIAEECGAPAECGILEIGPGIGTLTVELAKRFAKVTAVELDRGLIPILGETLADYSNVEVVCADFLSLDLKIFVSEHFPGKEVAVCANLPYYITKPVIMKLLESGVRFHSITIMVQREVAARLSAKPATPEYGAITAEVAWYCSVKKLFGVPASSFIPAPKVESAVVRLEPHEPPSKVVTREEYRKVVTAAFAKRRKTILNALSAGRDKEEVARRLNEAGIEPERRGETLSPEEFAAVALALRGIL